MTIEADIFTHLTATTSVTAIVGTKIRPNIAGVNDALPYIIYERLATDPEIHLLAGSNRANTRISLDCFSETYSSAQDLADNVFLALHGKTGVIGSHRFDSIFIENRFDDYIPPKQASDTGTHVASLTVSAWHSVTVPSSL